MQKRIQLGRRHIGGNAPAYIVAEIGRTYNNDLATSKRMVEAIAGAGGDAVKIQSIDAKELLVENDRTRGHYRELKALERSLEDHRYLKEAADSCGIDFISTPESLGMVDLLETVGVKAYKVASLDLVYHDLLKRIARTQKPIFLSTGMADMSEIADALNIIRSEQNDKVVLLYCVSLYPPEPEEMDLKTIETFADTFQVIPGYSDHTLGITTSIAAVALGAKVVEKHFTLDSKQPGKDHEVSLEPDEFQQMVREIRRLEVMLGAGKKTLSEREIALRKTKRRKIVAAHDLREGTRLDKESLKFKQLDSPAGIESQHEKQMIGRKVRVALKEDEPLSWDALQEEQA